jgi:hypothetical protein
MDTEPLSRLPLHELMSLDDSVKTIEAHRLVLVFVQRWRG